MSNKAVRVLLETWTAYLSLTPGFRPAILAWFVLLIFLVSCVVVFILFVFVLCLVPNVVCVSGLSILDFYFGFLFISACRNGNLCFLISFMIYHQITNTRNTTGTTSGSGTVYPSGAPVSPRLYVGFVLNRN